MPEGDSVLQLSQRLQFLVGKTVTHTSLRTPRYATHDFSGARCTKIWPYGKYLFMLFEEHILATHLKMEGSWAMHLVGGQMAQAWLHRAGRTAICASTARHRNRGASAWLSARAAGC